MKANTIRANARCLPLADESVDLVVTSPPYFSLRSYRDGDAHYDGQVGSELTPREFLEALWTVTAECWRVLKPTGTMFVNLGDKRSGSGGHNNNGLTRSLPGVAKGYATGTAHKRAGEQVVAATRRNAPDRYNQAAFGRPKSKMLLPHRYAIGCEDGLADPEGIGWIVRQDIVWSKPSALPESVVDRTRDCHEYWFQLNKTGRYFSAVDEVREAHLGIDNAKSARGPSGMNRGVMTGLRDEPVGNFARDPLGKLPGSVWTIASEPLIIPDAVKAHYGLPDHFAAFPQEWPRRLILGWSPGGVCTACGQGRRPVVAKERVGFENRATATRQRDLDREPWGFGAKDADHWTRTEATITGYACACPDDSAPTNPAVVLDPFMGTGTVLGVAEALGRTGIGTDLSMDYARLAKWRVEKSGHFAKTNTRTWRERQGAFDLGEPA